MSLITDNLSISYKFIAPRPFDEKLFIKKIEDLFIYKNDVLEVTVDEVGQVLPRPKPVYVAKDGRSELNFSPERGVVGIIGTELGEVSTCFTEIKTILETDLEIDFNNDIDYLELICKGRYKGKYQPMETLNKYQPTNEKIFKNFFDDEEINTMEIRVSNKSNLKTRKNIRKLQDWFDIRIFPFIINPNFYAWELVYRKHDITDVGMFWSKLDKKLSTMFVELEKEVS